MTYYDILGVPQTASAEEIKRAYRRLVQEFHPDKVAGIPPAVAKLAEEKFKDIQEAYEVLTKHRAEYDNQLRAVGSAATPPPSQPKAPAPRPPNPQPVARPAARKPGIWHFLGKIAGALPKQAWLVFGLVALFVVAALTSSNNTETPNQAAAPVTQQVPPATTVVETSSASAGQQTRADNKPVKPAPSQATTDLTGQYGGIVHNGTANASAAFGIAVRDNGGALSGCMGVDQPLFGSGPLSGQASGVDVSFVVTSAIGKITFVGQFTRIPLAAPIELSTRLARQNWEHSL